MAKWKLELGMWHMAGMESRYSVWGPPSPKNNEGQLDPAHACTWYLYSAWPTDHRLSTSPPQLHLVFFRQRCFISLSTDMPFSHPIITEMPPPLLLDFGLGCSFDRSAQAPPVFPLTQEMAIGIKLPKLPMKGDWKLR